MEQSNLWSVLAASMAKTDWIPGVQGSKAGDLTSEFQKLLDQKNQTAAKPADPVKENGTAQKETGAAEQETPVEQEDPLEQVKKLAEQGYVFVQPETETVYIDLKTGETIGQYGPGECVEAWKDGSLTLIPTKDLEPWEQMQVQQVVESAAQPVQTVDTEDPEADALLEATDPTVEHGPTELLDEAVTKEVSQVVRQVVKQVQPEQEESTEVEITDAEQAPQPLFEDVKAAPIKVGETYRPEQSEAADVNTQISSQLAQAMAQGQSRVEIQLTPENLGTVKVEIVQSQDGVLHIAINAENSQTRSLLERHAGNLQAMLADRGQTAVQVEVQRQEESQRRQENPYDGHNGQNQQQQGQHQRRQEHDSRDFIQQLRLGLIPMEGETL